MKQIKITKQELLSRLSNILLFFLFIGVMLFTGCQTTCPELTCPTVTCPVCEETVQEDLENIEVFFFDVGQGDSALIKLGDKEMLIDCGKNTKGDLIVNQLKAKGVEELEYLLVTHPDSDHLGGCDDVLREIKTHTVIVNGENKDTYTYQEFIDELNSDKGYKEQKIIASVSHVFPLGEAKVDILQGYTGSDDSNQNSLVARLDYKDFSVLFTGDCDKECEDNLLSKNIKSDILKVSHHGSKFATDIDLLEKVKPEYAIVSVGVNSYGHPTTETLDRLSQEGVVTYRTDLSGNIVFKSNGYNIRYFT